MTQKNMKEKRKKENIERTAQIKEGKPPEVVARLFKQHKKNIIILFET